MGESDELGPFRSVVNLMPDDVYLTYRSRRLQGKKIPAIAGIFHCKPILFPLLKELLTVLVCDQQCGVYFIQRCAARHVMNSFTI